MAILLHAPLHAQVTDALAIAQAEGSTAEWELHEEVIPQPKIREDKYNNLLVIKLKNNKSIELELEPQDSELNLSYSRLNGAERENFQKNRRIFLTGLGSVLSSTRLFYGVGSLARQQLSLLFKTKNKKGTTNHVVENLARALPPGARLQDRSFWVVENIIRAIDRALISQAQVIAEQNEFSVSASLGLLAEAGVSDRGYGGSVGLGISIGYNRKSQAFVFEIFSEVEKFNRAITPTAIVGIVPRAGVNMINQVSGREMTARRGHTTYPPLAYATATPELWSIGATTSLLSFPPILPEFMVYTHSANRKALLRLTVSPATRGWVRVNLGQLPERVQLIWQSVQGGLNTVRSFKAKNFGRKGMTCQALFRD